MRRKSFIILILISISVFLVACNSKVSTNEESSDAIKIEGPFYERTEYNFRIYAPDNWWGEVTIEEVKPEIEGAVFAYEIYSNTIRENNNEQGHLGMLVVFNMDYFNANKESIMDIVPSVHLGTNNFGDFVVLKASDVNYDVDNKEETELYNELYSGIDKLEFGVCST